MRSTLLALLLAFLVPALPAEESAVTPPVPENSPEWSLPGQYEVVIEVVGGQKEKVAEVVAGFSGLRMDYARHILKKLPVTVMRNASELRAKGSKAKLEAAGAKAKLVKQEKAGGSKHTGAPVVGSMSSKDYHPGGAAGSLSAAMKKQQEKAGKKAGKKAGSGKAGSMGAHPAGSDAGGMMRTKTGKKSGSATSK